MPLPSLCFPILPLLPPQQDLFNADKCLSPIFSIAVADALDTVADVFRGRRRHLLQTTASPPQTEQPQLAAAAAAAAAAADLDSPIPFYAALLQPALQPFLPPGEQGRVLLQELAAELAPTVAAALNTTREQLNDLLDVLDSFIPVGATHAGAAVLLCSCAGVCGGTKLLLAWRVTMSSNSCGAAVPQLVWWCGYSPESRHTGGAFLSTLSTHTHIHWELAPLPVPTEASLIEAGPAFMAAIEGPLNDTAESLARWEASAARKRCLPLAAMQQADAYCGISSISCVPPAVSDCLLVAWGSFLAEDRPPLACLQHIAGCR